MKDYSYLVEKTAEEFRDQIISWRKDFHRNPELSMEEFRTSKIASSEMERLGLEVKRNVGGATGFTALLQVDPSFPTIGLRADMDAISVTEDPKGKEEYASTIHGKHHGCGHDGHTACLMGAANILVKNKDVLRCNVKFIFQPGEELLPGGAKSMVEDGCIDGLEAVYAGHFNYPLLAGQARCIDGWILSTGSFFDIEIKGKAAHGGHPQHGNDVIMTASNIALNFNAIINRLVDPVLPRCIGINQFHAGEQHVSSPGIARLGGIYCTINWEQTEQIEKAMEQVVRSCCEIFGTNGEIRLKRGYPATINDPNCASHVREVLGNIIGRENIIPSRGTLGYEDFSYFLEKVPGAFFFIGAMNPEKGNNWPQHHPRYDLDEEALMIMSKTHSLIALTYSEFNIRK